MSAWIYIAGFALLLVFIAIVAGIAWCAHLDREYTGVDDEVHP
jgi:membrane associated rhomboid family serine protease